MYNERIQRIIELKEKLLEDRERQIEVFKREDDRISKNISSLQEDIDKRHQTLTKMDFTGGDFAIFNGYLTLLDANKSSCLKQQEEIRSQIEQTRSELTELLKEIKVLETLKAKALTDLRKSKNKKEQKRLDELALRGIRG